MFKSKHQTINFLLITALLGASLSLTGCESFRKKFKRDKKKTDAQRIASLPVLEPMDYPDKDYSPEDKYKKHYSSWKIWQEELILALDANESDKRQKYLVSQVLTQLEEMKKWVNQEKQTNLNDVIDDYAQVLNGLQSPAPMRNNLSLKRNVERAGKMIRENLTPQVMTNSYITISE